MLKDILSISHGMMHCDCTSDYYITIKEPITVRDFISHLLEDKTEWGYISIFQRARIKYIQPCIEYRYGEIIGTGNIVLDDILDCHILDITGSGGYSRSDYYLKLGGL